MGWVIPSVGGTCDLTETNAKIDTCTLKLIDIEDTVNSILSNCGFIEDTLDAITALHNVPTANSTANLKIRDVVGNKSDAYTSSSLVGLAKNNALLIGGVSTTANVIAGRTDAIQKSIVTPLLCSPTLKDGVDVKASSHIWELGDLSDEIIPENTIEREYRLHAMVLEQVDIAGTLEIVFYGNRTDEITRIRLHIKDVRNYHSFYSLSSDIIHAGIGVTAKMATNIGDNLIKVSLIYSIYR